MSLATWEEVEEIARKKREAEAAKLAAMTEAAAMAESEGAVASEAPSEEIPEVVAEVVARPVMTEDEPPVRRTRRGV